MKILLAVVCWVGMLPFHDWAEEVPPAEKADVRMNFPHAPVVDVLMYYGVLTGKKVIYDISVVGQIDLIVNQAITKSKAAELIERTMYLDGFTMVDTSDDVVSVIGLGKSARVTEMRICSSPGELPHGELLCTYLCKLKHRDAREMVGFLLQFVPATASLSFTPDPKSGMVAIVAPAGLIRNLLRVIDSLDVETPVPVAVKSTLQELMSDPALQPKPTPSRQPFSRPSLPTSTPSPNPESETAKPEMPVIQQSAPDAKPVGPGGN